jgi:Domain of unknown function (DUF2703)
VAASVLPAPGGLVRPFRRSAVSVSDRLAERKDVEMAVAPIIDADAPQIRDTLVIEFLFLDLTTCTRCLGADRSLESALEVLRDVLEATGAKVEVKKVLVESEDQARALRFVSSPTIRVDGRDVALELRESSCGSEACTDGCGDQIACRVWVHGGREYTEPPVRMIVEAILRHIYGGPPTPARSAAESYELPANLARFFAGKAASAASKERACCPSVEQRSCCDIEAKEDCCDAADEEVCGCR